MNAVPPPPSKKSNRDLPAPPTAAPSNIEPTRDEIADLNFKVDKGLRQRYKLASAMTGMTMKEILTESFEAWIRQKGLNV